MRRGKRIGFAMLAFLLAGCGVSAPAGWQVLTTSDAVPGAASGITCLVPDPLIKRLAYACTKDNGVNRIVTDGSSVGDFSEGMAAHSEVTAIATDPGTRGTAYAATSTGLYITTNAGDNWQAVTRPTGQAKLTALAITPQATLILVGTQDGTVYTSRDRAATWQPESSGLPHGHGILQLMWDGARKVALVLTEQGELFLSSNAGGSWQAPVGFSQGTDVHELAGGATALYAATSAGLFVTLDGGAHWTAAPGAPTGNATVVGASADGSAVIAAIGSTVIIAHNGTSWTPLSGNPDGSRMIAATQVTSPQGQSVLLIASDAVERYPALNGSPGPAASIISLAVSGLMLVALVYLFTRVRRQGLFATPRRRTLPSATPATMKDARPPSQRYKSE